MEFDWDDGKSDWTLVNRGFDFAYASQVFAGPVEEFIDRREPYIDPAGQPEERVAAIGTIDGRLFQVVYTMRDGVCWIISALKCDAKEVLRWKRHVAAGRSVPVASTSSA